MKIQVIIGVLLLSFFGTVQADDKSKVVSFSTILTEIATRVGGDRVEVFGVVKPGVDPHEFEPKPADMRLVGQAKLVLLSAKHMEGYVTKLKEATGTEGALVEVGDKFPSLKMKPEEGEGKPGTGKETSMEDPHWWHSIDNMKRATRVVQEELIKIDPAGKVEFATNAAAYEKELDVLQSWARTEIAHLARNQRKLVTSHDAFQYFGRDYGFTIYPIEGISPEDQPSSRKVAELIATIKKEHVKAFFPESLENPKVASEITKESGARVGGVLYADGLGEGSDVDTYAGMFRHNVTAIVEGLK